MKVNLDAVAKLQLDITMGQIENAILSQKKLKLLRSDIRLYNSSIKVYVRGASFSNYTSSGRSKTPTVKPEDLETFLRLQHLKRVLPRIVVRGYADAQRAVIKTDEKTLTNTLLVEGYGLKACMTTPGVDGSLTTSNSVIEVNSVLGIEAARSTIVSEINLVMGDMGIDPRHMQLLADVMTYKGEILGITRFGLAKMRDSVLQLASFEKTPDHLFEAGFRGKTDKVEGVSECIIVGRTMSVGTGALEVLRRLAIGELEAKRCVFEEAWKVDGTR